MSREVKWVVCFSGVRNRHPLWHLQISASKQRKLLTEFQVHTVFKKSLECKNQYSTVLVRSKVSTNLTKLLQLPLLLRNHVPPCYHASRSPNCGGIGGVSRVHDPRSVGWKQVPVLLPCVILFPVYAVNADDANLKAMWCHVLTQLCDDSSLFFSPLWLSWKHENCLKCINGDLLSYSKAICLVEVSPRLLQVMVAVSWALRTMTKRR